MPGNVLLDTNAAIALLNGDAALVAALTGTTGIFLPAACVGELYFGAFKSGRLPSNLSRVDNFVAANVVLASGAGTGRHYGRIKAVLRAAGTPIPDNDLWIAAVAIDHNLTLVTRDAHFQHVKGLSTLAW